MSSFKKTLLLLGFVLLAAAIFIIVVKFSVGGSVGNQEEVTVTTRSILDRVSEQYFIVTRSVFVNQDSEIVVDTGSRWSNIFWGQTIRTRGVIKVDIGVDMSQLEESDISIDHRSRTVSIDVPLADIMSATQYGDIEVESRQGVLKYVLDNDPNEDHNRALERLIADAKETVRKDQQLFIDARRDSARLLNLIIEGVGYQLEMVNE